VKSSVFGTAALLMNSGASPVLATLTDCGALVVPIACAANVREVGENVTAAAASAVVARTPSMMSETASALSAALPARLRVDILPASTRVRRAV
jgi:hypothetical protein